MVFENVVRAEKKGRRWSDCKGVLDASATVWLSFSVFLVDAEHVSLNVTGCDKFALRAREPKDVMCGG